MLKNTKKRNDENHREIGMGQIPNCFCIYRIGKDRNSADERGTRATFQQMLQLTKLQNKNPSMHSLYTGVHGVLITSKTKYENCFLFMNLPLLPFWALVLLVWPLGVAKWLPNQALTF